MKNIIDNINLDVVTDHVNDLIFNATISIVFQKNDLTPSVIEEFFPETIFKKTHDWETCPIDGCMSCVYTTRHGCNHNEAIIFILHFVNNGLAGSCKDCSSERVLVARKILAGTRVSTLELPGYCRAMFAINWA